MLLVNKTLVSSYPRGGVAHRRHGRGVSMIEVMVSIVLSSFALLALAAVNASSVRLTKMSQYRSTAAMLGLDIGERIRANKSQAASYALTADFAAQATTPTPLSGSALCNTSAICSTSQIATLDTVQWRILVRNQLPEGSAIVRFPDPGTADVWVVWRDPAVANTDESPAITGECPNSLGTSTDLSVRCSYFRINL